MDHLSEYKRWLAWAKADEDLVRELEGMNEAAIEDAFYQEMEFGTGGLRGIIGAGTNRMNIYTVARATEGLARYLGPGGAVVIGYDSRIKSRLFANITAGVLQANGIRAFVWPELMPVPTVSFAVRYLKASAGVMITSSHNPSKYNGYKVYGPDGCQITTEAAADILSEIRKVDYFEPVIDPDPKVTWIGDEVLDAYIDAVKAQSVLFGDPIDRDTAIVYSPLNGTGLKPVTRVLKEEGFSNITIVAEQEKPDGLFPTCPYPNPEIREAMDLGIEYCRRTNADLLLATDPDCDRVGIAVRDGEDYRLLSANETGLLLLDYICAQRMKHGQMPTDPIMMKTIVTMDLAERIAAHYGVRTINVLTGFKFIGEQIGLLENRGQADSFIFGFEESYGYLTGSYVRDKDGVDAALMICEMYAYYKTRGIGLVQKLNELFQNYGYCLNTLHTFSLPGSAGMKKMQAVMDSFRESTREIGGRKIEKVLDYSQGLDGLPRSNVLKFYLEGHRSIVIRPSGTEPKLKTYFSVSAEDETVAAGIEKELYGFVESAIEAVIT